MTATPNPQVSFGCAAHPSKGLLNPAMLRKRLPSTRNEAKRSHPAEPEGITQGWSYGRSPSLDCAQPAAGNPPPFAQNLIPIPPRSDGFQPSSSSPKNKARPTEPAEGAALPSSGPSVPVAPLPKCIQRFSDEPGRGAPGVSPHRLFHPPKRARHDRRKVLDLDFPSRHPHPS
jgi:hypothetical protein